MEGHFGYCCWSVLMPQILLCAQDTGSPNSTVEADGHTLQLTTIAEKTTWNGRRGSLWIYKSSDGTHVSVTSAPLASVADAKRQIREWLKVARRVTTKETKEDDKGQAVGERIVAVRQEGTGPEEFWIINRRGTYCYLTQSLSLPLAKYAEQSIERQRQEKQR